MKYEIKYMKTLKRGKYNNVSSSISSSSSMEKEATITAARAAK